MQQEESDVGRDTPWGGGQAGKGRRRPATSRAGERVITSSNNLGGAGPSRRGVGYGAPSTSRQSKKPWAPPTGGWDSTPQRSVPYALRGVQPVTKEPWGGDASRDGSGASGKPTAAKRAGFKRGVVTTVASAPQPAWDSSKHAQLY